LQRCYEFLKPSEEVKASQQSQYNYFYKQIENYEKMFENLKNLEIQNRENTSELEVNLQKCEEENLQMSYKVETLSELCTAISEEKEKLKSFYKELINVNKHLTNELEWRKKEYEQHEERYTNHIEELQKTIAFLNCELEKSKDEYEQQKKDHARYLPYLASYTCAS
jgi:chromosome segregation ATPase